MPQQPLGTMNVTDGEYGNPVAIVIPNSVT